MNYCVEEDRTEKLTCAPSETPHTTEGEAKVSRLPVGEEPKQIFQDSPQDPAHIK